MYKEGDDEVGVVPTNDEAVAGVDEGPNSSPDRVWSVNGSLSSVSFASAVLRESGVVAAGREGH